MPYAVTIFWYAIQSYSETVYLTLDLATRFSSCQVRRGLRQSYHSGALTYAPHFPGCVNVALFLTTRRVLPAGSVIPRSISQRFRTPSRSNTEQSICTPSTAAFTDVEKMIYAEHALSRTDSMGSESMYKVSTRTSTQYPETPVFSVGEPAEEYDDVALDSARLGSEPAWKPAMGSPDGLGRDERPDISAHAPRRVSSEPSPTIPVAIPTGLFRPFGDESAAP